VGAARSGFVADVGSGAACVEDVVEAPEFPLFVSAVPVSPVVGSVSPLPADEAPHATAKETRNGAR
jgi:hypothetical protein